MNVVVGVLLKRESISKDSYLIKNNFNKVKTMFPAKRSIFELILKTDGYFQIPDFQRPYTWDKYQIETFLSDLKRVAEKGNFHYFGTIVLVREDDHSVIIDGQQRLTTSLLLINAAYHVLKNAPSKSPDKNYTAESLRKDFLVNTYNSNTQNREKITLRTVTTDNCVLEKIFNGEELNNDEKASKLCKAHTKFKSFLDTQDNIDDYINALKKFEIVEITLNIKDDDNPQLVFENINSTGKPLSAGDKIRNWALMLNNKESRALVYKKYWKNIENNLTHVENGEQVDEISDFFRTYLMCKKDVFVSDANTYPLFKESLGAIKDNDIESIKGFYGDVMKYLSPYLSIKFMVIRPPLDLFREQLFSLKFLQTDIINTVVIHLFVDFLDNKLSQEEVANSLYLIETFLTRRMICGFKTEGLNMRFPELHKIILAKQEKYPGKTYDDCLSAWMVETRGRTSALPTDADITNSIKTFDFFRGTKKHQQQYVLAKICDQSKESTLLHNLHDRKIKLSVEHIMPQKLTPVWKSDLGGDWENIYTKWVHTLANLSLTAYNQKYSNRPFVEKKTMDDGFAKSPLLLNKYIAEFDEWIEDSLEKRAHWLSEQIVKIWRYPQTTLPSSIEDIVAFERYSPYDWEVETFRKPEMVFIGDDCFEVKSWVGLYNRVLLFIQENFLEEFMNLIDNNELFGIADRPLISKDKSNVLVASEISRGIFVEQSLGVPQIMQKTKMLCEYVGYNEDNCPISFTVTST